MDFVLKNVSTYLLVHDLNLDGTKVQRSIGKTLCTAYVYPLVNNLGCWRKKYDITFIYYFLTNSAIQKNCFDFEKQTYRVLLILDHAIFVL